jgi:hypothetical protein
VRDRSEHLLTNPLPEFHNTLLMARGAEVAALTGKCK